MQNLPVLRLAIAGFTVSLVSFFLLDEWFYHLVLVEDKDAREIWNTITYLGDSGWMLSNSIAVWLVALLISRFNKNPAKWKSIANKGLFVFTAVALPGITAMIFKGVIGRARPYLYDTEGPKGFSPFEFESIYASYPSGHTTTAFAFATAFILIFPQSRYVAIPLALVAGLSRMTLGAHYLADVIMGATLGTLGAVLVFRWLAPKLKL